MGILFIFIPVQKNEQFYRIVNLGIRQIVKGNTTKCDHK